MQGPGRLALAGHAVAALPQRFLAYPGNTLWTEEGFRFAWRVMLSEKQGDLDLTVLEPERRRTR